MKMKIFSWNSVFYRINEIYVGYLIKNNNNFFFNWLVIFLGTHFFFQKKFRTCAEHEHLLYYLNFALNSNYKFDTHAGNRFWLLAIRHICSNNIAICLLFKIQQFRNFKGSKPCYTWKYSMLRLWHQIYWLEK